MKLKLPAVKLERVKLIAEIAAAIAVVLSLVFVGLQVRESALQTELNTAAIEVSAYQDLMTQIAEYNRLAIEDPDVARIQTLETVPLGSLSAVEERRHVGVAFLLIRHGDLAYLQFERGMLDADRLHSAMAPLRQALRSCYAREVWALNRQNFVPGYRAYVDEVVASGTDPCAPPPQDAAAVVEGGPAP